MKNTEFRIPHAMYEELHAHLFPGDGDEHGAIITAGICQSSRGTRFLARELFLAKEEIDYVPGRYGYRALSADFVARISHHCSESGLCYFAVHCHGGSDRVEFSEIDLESHRRGYPALLDICAGGPVGALVFARNAVAGEIWTRDGVFPLDFATIVGRNHQKIYPSPPSHAQLPEEIYHRQSLLFGARGQDILRGAKIGIIGLGGVGALVNEWVSRLGVGEIVAIDFDRIEPSNHSRIVGARRRDSLPTFSASPIRFLSEFAKRRRTPKVDVARRVAIEANPDVRYEAVMGNVVDESVALKLKDADFVFLCADSMQSRLVFNALVHQYLVPGVQIGSKVSLDGKTGGISDIFCVSRIVMPEPDGGCLWCNHLISPAMLQNEAMSDEQRRDQAYVADAFVHAPSVLSLNALGASQAVNECLFSLLGLHVEPGTKTGYMMCFPRERLWTTVDCRLEQTCRHCGTTRASVVALGDKTRLPCRLSLA